MFYTKELANKLKQNIKAANLDIETGQTFKVIATDETLDRSGEILSLDGWEFKNYMKNPIIIANHDYKIENIIGKCTKIYEEDNKVIVEGVFSKTNPLGILAANLYNEGMLKTVSVGFIDYERDGNIITKKELLELSFVAVPCNPSAISLDEKTYKKAIDTGLIKETIDENQDESQDETPDDKKPVSNAGAGDKPLYEILEDKIKSNGDYINKYLYVTRVYASYCVFYTYGQDEYGDEKMFKQDYTNDGVNIEIIGAPVEVEQLEVYKPKHLIKDLSDNNDKLDIIIEGVNDIKNILSESVPANDKAKELELAITQGQGLARAVSKFLESAKKAK